MMLSEMTIRPADPRWFSHLTLRPGMEDGARYDLDPASYPKITSSTGSTTFVARRKAAYLSMMLEELPECHNNRQLVAARCVHLDTEDRVGTRLENATMKHLDLAKNVYDREATKTRRWKSRISKAK
jgi:hypothetical protein